MKDKEVADLVVRNTKTLGYLAQMLADHTVFLYDSIKKCQCCSERLGTVKHNKYDVILCDRCCAEVVTIVTKGMNISSPSAKLDLLIRDTVNEESWHDIPTAQSARMIEIFYDQLKDTLNPELQ